MTNLIKRLPDNISNQIAAGEVVQRPASAVKELMENSVDAGSTKIQLIVKDAGKKLIQVIDNGCGMGPEDARMSFERHATSKIFTSEDLNAIRTMGFRGEAMASIAAVAQVEMYTRLQDEEMGTFLQVENSSVIAQEPCQAAKGTSILVKNLFYNVPARRNFLKSDVVEFKHVLDEFTRISLAFPDIHFSLYHNDKEVHVLPPGNLRQRITHIFGSLVNKKLVPIEENTEVVNFFGFIGKPEFAKRTRGEQYFFVNNRFIRSPYLHKAVSSAYEGLIGPDQYPLYVIFLELDPKVLDINIHPTKQEIRFEDERLIYQYLRVAVRHALGQFNLVQSIDFDVEGPFSTHEKAVPYAEYAAPNKSENAKDWQKLFEDLRQQEIDTGDFEMEATIPEKQTVAKPILQLHGKYIVCQSKEGLMLIHLPHAWHRIYYEEFLKSDQGGDKSTQKVLYPEVLNLGPSDAEILDKVLPHLSSAGFEVSCLGQGSYAVQGTPVGLNSSLSASDWLETFIEEYKSNTLFDGDVREKTLDAMIAAALGKTNMNLDIQEMEVLIGRLFSCHSPTHSPRGGKCFTEIRLKDLDKMF
jgi:DNA mismatch repair protein MutL